VHEAEEEKEMNTADLHSSMPVPYTLRAAELDLVRSIPRKELPQWINYNWAFEANKEKFLNRLKKENEDYYE
jgi:hypothetical protein